MYSHIISQELSFKWGHLRERSSASRRAGSDSVRVLYNSLFCENPTICSYVPTKLLIASLNKPQIHHESAKGRRIHEHCVLTPTQVTARALLFNKDSQKKSCLHLSHDKFIWRLHAVLVPKTLPTLGPDKDRGAYNCTTILDVLGPCFHQLVYSWQCNTCIKQLLCMKNGTKRKQISDFKSQISPQ